VQTKNITLNVLGLSLNDDSEFYTTLHNEFNNYSKKENLNIELNLITLANSNSTAATSPIAYVTMLDDLYQRKDIKYDIVFYFNYYLDDFDKYFINLYDYFNEDHINLYDPLVLSLSCIKNNKLIGFVRS